MKSRKWLPILLGTWPYLVLVLMFSLASEENQYYGLVLLFLILMTAVVYILNIINACICKKEEDRGLALADMLIKLVHIPFYLLVFIIGAMALLIMVVPAFVFISPLLVITLIVIDFFLMITSSAYGINALIRARRNGSVSTKFVVIHSIMHLFFVLDIISAVVVFVKLRKADNLTNKERKMYQKVENWLNSVLTQKVPAGVAAYIFNLYEDEGSNWSIELVGTGRFDEEDEDWACDEVADFGTRENPLTWQKDVEWSEALEEMITVLKQYLDTGMYADVLKMGKGVGVGFVDGDIEILYAK